MVDLLDPHAMDRLLAIKGALVGGLGLWLGLIAFNNINDPNTNVTLLHRMFSMEGLEPDGELGQGLRWRAVRSRRFARGVLGVVVAFQVLAAGLMVRGGAHLLTSALGAADVASAVSAANLGLLCFMLLWLFFLCGGLWYGYWITMGTVQTVHLMLLLVTVATIGLVNL